MTTPLWRIFHKISSLKWCGTLETHDERNRETLHRPKETIARCWTLWGKKLSISWDISSERERENERETEWEREREREKERERERDREREREIEKERKERAKKREEWRTSER
jgi:hypothetical protein